MNVSSHCQLVKDKFSGMSERFGVVESKVDLLAGDELLAKRVQNLEAMVQRLILEPCKHDCATAMV